MQPNGVYQGTGVVPQNWAVTLQPPQQPPFLARFLGKLVLDVLPAVLASVIGGFLFTQYQFGRVAAVRPMVEQAAPASAEMVQLVRDEHAMIIDYLKVQAAAENSRHAAEDAASARAAEPVPDTPARIATAAAPSKPAAPRAKPAVVASSSVAPRAPLVIAQAEQNNAAAPAVPAGRLASDPDSLLAKTLDLKDHVVAATRHVVGVIGDAITSVGGLIGSAPTDSGSARQQFSDAS